MFVYISIKVRCPSDGDLIYNSNTMIKMLKNKDELIYDLIFSTDQDYSINIAEYVEDIYKYDKFVDDIKQVLRKSKVSIVKENVLIETNHVIWELKVKK